MGENERIIELNGGPPPLEELEKMAQVLSEQGISEEVGNREDRLTSFLPTEAPIFIL